MKTQILVYVGNGESADFKSGNISLAAVRHPTSNKAKNKIYGLYGDQYRVKNDLINGYCFFVMTEEYTNAKKENVRSCMALSQDCSRKALLEYLNVIRSMVFDFLSEDEYLDSPVYVITHWGGGTPDEIDENEKKLGSILDEIRSTDDSFANWYLLSASETHRPKLFSEGFNTVAARKKKNNGEKNWQAQLPDAEECKKILERHQRKEYGSGCVDWFEPDPKELYYDIMNHLNH